jgi:outer membrane protein OmpA-like peptidoglycan-associated protein
MGLDNVSGLKKSRIRRNVITGVILATSVTIAGCSWVPDAVNPVKWVDNTVGFFAGDDEEGQKARKSDKKLGTLKADRGAPPPGEGKPAPNLGNFPKGLSGDRSRQYASAPIARQRVGGSSVKAAPSAPPAPPVIAKAPILKAPSPSEPPPPPAVPTAPVQNAGINAPAPPPIAAPRLAAPAPMPGGPVKNAFSKSMTTMVPSTPEPQMNMANTFSDYSTEPLSTVIISSAGVEIAGEPTFSAARGQTRGRTRVTAPMGNRAPRFGAVRATSSAAKAVALKGRVRVATIIFTNGSSRLTGRDVKILRDVLKLKRQKNGQKVVVVGHASSRTRNMNPVKHKMVNFQISVSRADIVAKELHRLGLKSSELFLDAVSDTEPAYFEVMPSGEAGNRRAEVYIDFPA